MPLLGTAAIVIWVEIDPAKRAAHDAWHSGEHLAERLSIPGFLRGRRCAGDPRSADAHFVLYELESIAVATSPAYLERLNNPSPWTRRVMADVRLTRALCRIAASHGEGMGGSVLTVQLAPPRDEAPALQARITGELLPRAMKTPGITGAHLLQRDTATVRPATDEEKIRGGGDRSAEWIIVIEGYDAGAVFGAIAPDELAGASPVAGRYGLAHTLASLRK